MTPDVMPLWAPQPWQVRATLRISAYALAVAVGVAVATRLLDPAGVRDMLGYGFTPFPATLGAALGIVVANAGVLGFFTLATILIQGWRVFGWGGRRAERLVRLGCDALTVVVAGVNLAVVGLAIGGYGRRALEGLLAHGVVEVAGFALGGAVYVRARRHPVSGAEVAVGMAWALAVLVLAALLETFVGL